MYPKPKNWFLTLLLGPGMKVTVLGYSPRFKMAVHMAELYVSTGHANEKYSPLPKWPLRTAWRAQSGGSAVYVVVDNKTRTETGFPLLTVKEALDLVQRPTYELVELTAELLEPVAV